MEKGQELFESWVKSQNDFFDTWMDSQEKFMANYTESVTAIQKSIKETSESQQIPGADRYYPEYLNWLYSPNLISEEFEKNQELLKTTFHKQMEIFKEMVNQSKNSFEKK